MKKIIPLLMAGIVIFLYSGEAANAQTYRDQDGNGLIEIRNINQLDSMRYNLTGACPSPSNCTGYELTRNLDFSSTSSYRSGSINTSYTTGDGWNPIGDNSTAFNAIFEGNGYTIDHLYSSFSTSYRGLFGYIGSNSHIRNIGVTNVHVSGSLYVGGLVGYNNGGTITQAYATGNVTGFGNIGGLVGASGTGGTITQTYATGSVSCINSPSCTNNVGGLVGENFGIITQSYATGNVVGKNVGGLVGSNSSGTIRHGYWNTDASQTEGTTVRTTANKVGIGTGSGTFVKGLTLTDMKSPTATATDSIRKLGPGFRYKEGQLPRIHKGARVTVNGVNFTQTLPSSTNIAVGNAVANINQGKANSRATLTVMGIAFTANVIDTTSGRLKTSSPLTYIQNGRGTGIIDKYSIGISFTSIGNKKNNDAPFTLQATNSQGLPVLFSASNNLVSINGNNVTINNRTGAVNITAYGLGNDSIFVTPFTQTISIFLYTYIQVYRDRDSNGLIEISSIEQLDSIRYNLTGDCIPGCHGYELTRNLDFRDSISSYRSFRAYRNRTHDSSSYAMNRGWKPIGTFDKVGTDSAFNAIFEGNGYTIDHLYINRSSSINNMGNNIGLFGYTESNSRISNIGVTNVSVSGYSYVGALAGNNSGTITQSYATGNVTGNAIPFPFSRAGGLVGSNYLGTITQSYATVSVLGYHYIGGLVGSNSGTITQSYATGKVTSNAIVGGSTSYVGGLVGDNYGTITQSYATGSVLGTNNAVSGMAGWNYNGNITQSYATGDVAGSGYLGGLMGWYYSGTMKHGYWNKDASQTVASLVTTVVNSVTTTVVVNSARSNSDKLGIGHQELTGVNYSFIRDLTLRALKSPAATATDSILELGPGFIYKQGRLPRIHFGARVSVNNIDFTQTVPSITNIVSSDTVARANVIQGTTTTRATLTVGGIAFTANVIGATNIATPFRITNIQNGVKKLQAITFTSIGNKTYGNIPFVVSATSTGLKVLFSSSNAALVSINNKDTVTIKGTGTVNITAYSAANDTLYAASQTQIFTINKAKQSINFGALASKTFGTGFFVLSATSSARLKVLYSASNPLVSISNDTVSINGAGTVIITAFQTGNANYLKADSVVQILTINKARRSISFSALAQKTFGDASFILSATSSVGLSVSYSASNPLVSISNNMVSINGVGTVIITAYQTGNVNYLKADSVVQILTINKARRSISFGALAQKTFGNAPFVLIASSSVGLSVSYSASNTALVSISDNTVSIKGAGTVIITAFQTGNANYLKADSVVQILTINKANQSISFGALGQKTFGNAPFVVSASSSAGLTVSYSSSNTAIASINESSVTIKGPGTVNITAFQTGNIDYNPAASAQNITILDPTLLVPTINFTAIPNLTIGQEYVLIASSNSPVAITFTSSDTNKLSIVGKTATAKAKGSVTITANQAGNAEYNPATSAQNVTVLYLVSLINFTAIPNLTIGQKYTLVATSNSPVVITFTSSDTNKLSIVGKTATAKARGNVTITANQEENTQYNADTSVQSVTVLDPALPVPAINFTAIPNLTVGQKYVLIASSNSPVAITFTSSDTSKLRIVGNTATAKASGSVTITAKQEGDTEFNATSAQQTVTVVNETGTAKPTPTITFTAIPNLTVGQKYTLVASSNSPVVITFASSDEKIATVSGNTLTAVGTGTAVITANQVGNAEFNATSAQQTVTVVTVVNEIGTTTPTLTFTAISNLTVGQKYTLVATSNSPVVITFASSDEKIATVSGNILTAVATGTAVITANQVGNAEFNVASAQQTVTVVNETGATPALTFIETHNTSIHIFPNPANDYMTIQYDKTQKVSSVKVYDMTGKNYELKMNNYELGMKADVKNLPKGEYILVIYGEKDEVLKTEKVIKK